MRRNKIFEKVKEKIVMIVSGAFIVKDNISQKFSHSKRYYDFQPVYINISEKRIYAIKNGLRITIMKN